MYSPANSFASTDLRFSLSGMPMTQCFGTEVGPILLDNVTCDQSHLELLQCVHLLYIGVHNCVRENVAGVICPNMSAMTTINIPSTLNTTTTETTSQNTSSFTLYVYSKHHERFSSLYLFATNTLFTITTNSSSLFTNQQTHTS